jgi:hypothetical protein
MAAENQPAELVARSACQPAAWDSVASRSDDGWLWHRHDYQGALATWPGRVDRSFALIDPAGAIRAIVPLHVVDLTWRGVVVSRQGDSLGGPAVAPALQGAARDACYAQAVRSMTDLAADEGALFLDVRLPTLSPRTSVDALSPRPSVDSWGFENRAGQAYVVDLSQPEATLWAGLEKRVRTVVRKAARLAVVVRAADRPGDLDAYYALHLETYRRTRATPHPRAYFEAIWRLVDDGRALALAAEVDGRTVAAATFGLDKGTSLYWTGANGARGLEVGAGALLQWEGMRRLGGRGVRWHEVGEAFPERRSGKARGLDLFKRGFGGTLHPICRGRRVLRPRIYRALQAAQRFRGPRDDS